MGLKGARGVAAVASAGLLMSMVPSAAASAHRSRGPIFVAAEECSGHDRKPHTIVISCGNGNFYAAHLRYSRYGRRTAQASGSLRYSPCFPDCPSPHFTGYHGSITLSDIHWCQGRRFYERIAWHFTRRHPFPDGAASLHPQACNKL